MGVLGTLEPGFDLLDLHVTMRVNGAVVSDVTYGESGSQPLAFPMELPFLDLPDGDLVEVAIEAPNPDPEFPTSPMIRVARTSVVAGKTLLLRVFLITWCAPWYESDESIPLCNPPATTCTYGLCRDPYAPPAGLEEYSPDWAMYEYCKPKSAGAPEVHLGYGERSFTPLNDFDVVSLTPGNQGGHHIWTAIHMKNIAQLSTLTVSGYVPDLDVTIGPFSSSWRFIDDPASGYCERVGVIFRLDDPIDYAEFLGLAIQITATVVDQGGATAQDTKLLSISGTVL